MREVALLSAAAAAALLGCASCDGGPPGRDADVEVDADGDGRDADADVDADGDVDADTDTDADTDADADIDTDADRPDAEEYELPDPEPVELVELPPGRPGMECGVGCLQISFADSVFRSLDYGVSDAYVVYKGEESSAVYLVELDTARELRIDDCIEDWCSQPAVDGPTVAFSTSLRTDDTLQTLWRYTAGERERYPLVRRRMTERSRPLMGIDIDDEEVAWYDSAVRPAGLYAMSLAGGDVTSLTTVRCVCYGDPHLWGRQVVYQGWQTGPTDIWLVDVDSLEERDLTENPAPQFTPAFDGEWVVWADGRNDPSPWPELYRVNPDIHGMELPFGADETLCDDPGIQVDPDVHGGLVAWEDFRNAREPNDYEAADADSDIYVLELEGRREHRVTDLPGRERMPRLWGRRLFFVAEDLVGQDAIFMVDLVEAGVL